MSARLKSSTVLPHHEILRQQEQQKLEQALPAHLLFLVMEAVVKQKKAEFRSDIAMKLNVAASAPLQALDQFSIARLARKIDESVRSLVSHLSVDDTETLLAASAFFILKLVDEGLFPDKQNMAVIVAIMMITDMRELGSDWVNEEVLAHSIASKMMTTARLMGLYLGPTKVDRQIAEIEAT